MEKTITITFKDKDIDFLKILVENNNDETGIIGHIIDEYESKI